MNLGNYEGALATLNEYVEYANNPENAMASDTDKISAYYERGKLKIEHLNQKEEGLKDLKKVLEYDNSDFYKEEYENAKK